MHPIGSAAESSDSGSSTTTKRRHSIVDELLTEIYDQRRSRWSSRRRMSSTPDESDRSSSPDGSTVDILVLQRLRHNAHNLRIKNAEAVKKLLKELHHQVKDVMNVLVRLLIRRDHLVAKRDRQYDIVTAILQAASPKRGVDTRIMFSVEPRGSDTGFLQWHDAMKMVARLPGGIPPDFRKRLWLTMAEKHLQTRHLDWEQAKRMCFNQHSNPDDDELGIQIVKDLHRTGCSLFCGEEAEHNQALLKRVLLAFARWNKVVGYCQGFNMLAAIILEVTKWCDEDALKVMIYLIEGVLPESYFANNLSGLSVDMAVFRELLRLRLPTLSCHLDTLQAEARESASGVSYEPPLTNVFTMQWFLTLFSNYLPKATVLRVWDLIFLEGNEVLLRTALAIWDGLSDRIMTVESADEFYSIMRVLTREMLEFGLMDANHLVKTICMMAPFPFPQLAELRDKYTYNITPFTAAFSLAKRAGFRLFHSDDEDEDESQNIAVAAWCFSSVLPHQVAAIKVKANDRRGSIGSVAGSNNANFNMLGPGAFGPTPAGSPTPSHMMKVPDRTTLDISALRKQYTKLRERQRQAHVIVSAAHIPKAVPNRPTATVVNHLLVGKRPLVSKRRQSQKEHNLILPPSKPLHKEAPALGRKASTPMPRSGETLEWTQLRKEKRASLQEAAHPRILMEEKDKASRCDSRSSSSTELCDEDQAPMSDFDSEDETISGKPFDSLNEATLKLTDSRLPKSDSTSHSIQNDLVSRPSSTTTSSKTSGPDSDQKLSSNSSPEEELKKSSDLLVERDDRAFENEVPHKSIIPSNSPLKNDFSTCESCQEGALGPIQDATLPTPSVFTDSPTSQRSLVDDWLIKHTDISTGHAETLSDNKLDADQRYKMDIAKGETSFGAATIDADIEESSCFDKRLAEYEAEISNAVPCQYSHLVDSPKNESELSPGSCSGEQSNIDDSAKQNDLHNVDSVFKEQVDISSEIKDNFEGSVPSLETSSDERFKNYIIETCAKFLERTPSLSVAEESSALSNGYKSSKSKEHVLRSAHASAELERSESLKTRPVTYDNDDHLHWNRTIPRRMSCTDLPQIKSFEGTGNFNWFFERVTENDTKYGPDSENAEPYEDDNKFLKSPKSASSPEISERESPMKPFSFDQTFQLVPDENNRKEMMGEGQEAAPVHVESVTEEEGFRDQFSNSDSANYNSLPLTTRRGVSIDGSIPSSLVDIEKSFSDIFDNRSFEEPSNLDDKMGDETKLPSSLDSMFCPLESKDFGTVWSTRHPSLSNSRTEISRRSLDSATSNNEIKSTKNLVGNISLRSPTSPITFNPFPTSRRSPSKLPTAVGLKLGMYDSAGPKTESSATSPTKKISPIKRNLFG